MTTTKLQYDVDSTLGMTLDALASDSNLLAGRCSAAVDNTVSDYLDVKVSGKLVSNGTSLAGGIVEVFAYAYVDSADYTGSVPGTDSNYTIGSDDKLQLRLIAIVAMDTRAGHTYAWGPVSIAAAFGGVMPSKWGLFIDQNTGSALGTGNTVTYKGATLQTA